MSTAEVGDIWKQLSLEVIVTIAENGNELIMLFPLIPLHCLATKSNDTSVLLDPFFA